MPKSGNIVAFDWGAKDTNKPPNHHQKASNHIVHDGGNATIQKLQYSNIFVEANTQTHHLKGLRITKAIQREQLLIVVLDPTVVPLVTKTNGQAMTKLNNPS